MTYLTMTIIVLINLLIAMMSDTYCRIQEQVLNRPVVAEAVVQTPSSFIN